MLDYQKLHLVLFNAVTDAIDQIDAQNYGMARSTLVHAQCESEELFINMEDGTDCHEVR